MASVQERLKLKRAPTDIWSIREQLCLASSVLKSGDQNWMSVSRSLRSIADKDCIRPQDWFSQKSCAQQYAYLLENADIPKRKKRESGETTSESIVRRLTQDRISQLSKTLAIQREEYQQLKSELNLIRNGIVSDEKLQKMWLAIEQEQKEQEQNNKTHFTWLNKCQQNKEFPMSQILNVQNIQKKADILIENVDAKEAIIEEEEGKRNKVARSSLLTSLLKSPGPTPQMQVSAQAAGSPTITSLLGSSPKVPGPIIVQNVSPQLHQLVSNPISNMQERPSTSAPTLSMLLEQPAGNTQNVLQHQLQNTSNSINSKNLQAVTQVQNTIQTRSTRLGPGSSQISQVQQIISSSDFPSIEITQIIPNPIDQVMPKVLQMDKDEINEIIGDIEELIKEEITGSPQSLESGSRTVEIIDNLNIQTPTEILTENTEPRNVDESVSVSNSPTSEISIEEIDSSTSNIAEIIGTAIDTVETKANICEPLQEILHKKIFQDNNKEMIELSISKDLKISTETTQDLPKQSQNKSDSISDINISNYKEIIFVRDKNKIFNKEKEDSCNNTIIESIKEELAVNNPNVENKKMVNKNQEKVFLEVVNILSDKTNNSQKLEKKNEFESYINIFRSEKTSNNMEKKEHQNSEENTSINKTDNFKLSPEIKFEQSSSESNNKVSQLMLVKELDPLKKELSIEQENKNFVETIEESDVKDILEKKNINEMVQERSIETDSEINNEILPEKIYIDFNNEKMFKKEKLEDIRKNEKIKDNEVPANIHIELKKENPENNEDFKSERDVKKEIENDILKKETVESLGSVEELEEEESTLSKLSGGRAMKTYSKKQNATVDSEPENESSGETADYRAWKKSIMLVYNRLATHKYASIFLRPITEDQAPGYHSIIFRPMDLWTIKKNIDNGTIRSTTHFQRDIMLMFQNAIMFNKYNTLVHKMTLEMQEECLQHMQVLVRAAGEASFRRETRTAANISNEAIDNNLKRKWTHISSSPHYETENSRMKKRRKSEND